MATARANAMQIDKEFTPLESALKAFSTSPNFSLHSLDALDVQARKLVVQQNMFNIVLENESGQQLINTFLPYGASLPREQDSPSLMYLRTSDKTLISSVFVGPLTKRSMVAVGVPAKTIEGDWVALTANVTVERFGSILRQQKYPRHWIVSIIDRGGQVVARSADMERFVGTKAPASLLERMRQQSEATFETQPADGMAAPALVVTARATNSGWTVAISIPLEQLKAEVRQKLLSLVLATIGLLGIGLLLAWRIGNRISQAVSSLVAPALALGSGMPIKTKSYGVREAEEVGDALEKASAMLQHAQHQATHDVLTGIANRAMFHAFLERQLATAEREQRELSILYLDLDNFKPINDTYGHAAGDKLLIAASQRLTSQLRRSDIAARVGGDEFAVALYGDASETAIVKAKLEKLMAQPYLIDGIELSANASIGVATYPQAGTSVSNLLAAADEAMYRTKAERKNGNLNS